MAFDLLGHGGAAFSLVYRVSGRRRSDPEDFYVASSLQQTKVSAAATEVHISHVAKATAAKATREQAEVS